MGPSSLLLSALGVVLGCQAAELDLDLVLGNQVADPSVLVTAVVAGVTGAPGEVTHQAFCFALAFAGLLPAAAEGFGIPGWGPLGEGGPFDQPEADLDPAQDFGRGKRAAEEPVMRSYA